MRRLLGGLVVGALVLAGCSSGTGGDHQQDPADRAQLAAGDSSPKIVAAGDIACPPGDDVTRTSCRQAKTARAALALSPDQVIVLGDAQYENGRYRAFMRSYAKSWGNLLSITWPVVGNHEYHTAGARGYFRYFAARQPGSPGWYRRELNGWQLYLLNSNCGDVDCKAQRAWLTAEMEAHPSECSLIAMHVPRFSSGSEHGSSTSVKPFWQIGYDHGVDVALAGHDHDQERFVPMKPDGTIDSAHGIQQFVSGGGGRSLYAKGDTEKGSAYFRSGFGVLELTLGPHAYSWRFLSPRLKVRDSGSADCR